MKTIFEQIISGEQSGVIVYQNEYVVVLQDQYPMAPLHLLIIPRKPLRDFSAVEEEDLPLIAEIFRTIRLLVQQFHLEGSGYRVVMNTGNDAGQTVPHLHFHILAGRLFGVMG